MSMGNSFSVPLFLEHGNDTVPETIDPGPSLGLEYTSNGVNNQEDSS